MSRIPRVLLAASISAVSLTTLTLPVSTFAAGSVSPAPAQYEVKPGDFLAGIAAKVGVTLPALLSANNLTTKSLILPGEKLTVPSGATVAAASATASAPAAGGLVHTVKSGEFLLGIATIYKVTLADLLAVNKLTVKSLINPGMQLALPAAAVAAVAPQAAGPTAPSATDLTYVVQNNDFLAGIASKYKVKLPDLLTVNKLKSNSLILPGMKLALPVGAIAPALAVVTSQSPLAAVQVQSVAGPADTVVAYAYAQLGKPYRFFSAGPTTFDCSGLVKAAFGQIGIEMIHQSASQASYGTAVDIWSGQAIKAGDLVFMATSGTIHHVGIAVDATRWIHAPAPGDVVRLSPMPAKGSLTTVRRIVGA